MKKKVFFEKFWNFRILKIFFEKSWIFKKIIKFQIALKTSLFELWTNQKNCNEIFYKLYIHEKSFGARALARAAHAKSHFVLKTQKSSKFGSEGKIFYRRARGSARAPKWFLPSYFHKILHLSSPLDVFISLELIAVDGFEVGARRCTCEHHRGK